jgi:hypothetical protein
MKFDMEKGKTCRRCGELFVSVALAVTFLVPAELCERCKHEESPHTHEESARVSFFEFTVSGAVDSTASVFTGVAPFSADTL